MLKQKASGTSSIARNKGSNAKSVQVTHKIIKTIKAQLALSERDNISTIA